MVRDDDQEHNTEQWRCLALLRIPQLGAAGYRRLRQHFPDTAAVFTASPEALRSAGLNAGAVAGIRRPDRRRIEADRAWLRDSGARLVTWEDPLYPPLLKEIPDAPPGLFIRGEPAALSGLQVAVVGSRNPSPSGRRIARQFGAELGRAGITITSGLAVGIDSQAHEGALEAGAPTVAVLGCGLDTLYPRRNRGLAERIAESGALVTEFPPGTPPVAANFPRRNRLISGLGGGVVVVEAALKSGSLITARFAMEQGREVFAVPGAIHNPLSQGCHALIRQGAKLTEQIEDILEELGPLNAVVHSAQPGNETGRRGVIGLDGAAKVLLDNIGDVPVTVDDLIDLTQFTVDEICALLLRLELLGLIESMPGGAYVRR
jgi:DNA processing protein